MLTLRYLLNEEPKRFQSLHSGTSLTNKFIVLDLDSTLIFTMKDSNLSKFERALSRSKSDTSNIIYKIPDIHGSMYAYGVKRPNVNLFLRFCFYYFRGVCVWSAGIKLYVDKIVEELFHDLPRPYIVFDRSDCWVDENGDYYKPLEEMCKLIPEMNLSNTIILDDNPDTIKANVDNGMIVPPYQVTAKTESIEAEDRTFFNLMWYFMMDDVINCEDVRSLVPPNFMTI